MTSIKQTLAIGLTLLATTTFAAPAYVPYAYNESIPAIHGRPITANNGLFWINKPTTATCATWAPNCPSENTTIISGPVPGAGTWWMGILGSGGQEIFTSGPYTGGQMGYAALGSNNLIPARSEGSNFVIHEQGGGVVTMTAFDQDWSACWYTAADDGSFAVKTGQDIHDDGQECYDMQIELRETTAPAVDYYDCEGCESRCNSIYGC